MGPAARDEHLPLLPCTDCENGAGLLYLTKLYAFIDQCLPVALLLQSTVGSSDLHLHEADTDVFVIGLLYFQRSHSKHPLYTGPDPSCGRTFAAKSSLHRHCRVCVSFLSLLEATFFNT